MGWITGHRRLLLGLAAGAVAFSTVFAMAASLGGINGAGLGADSGSTTACDTDGVSTTWVTAYDATDARYEVTDVTVTGINNACDGETIEVTVTNSANAALGSGTLTIPTDSGSTQVTVTLSAAVSAENLTGIHVLIA